jgi:hypothetical protein
VSRRRLAGRKSLPTATCDWALDSGGFTELEKYGRWSILPEQFVAEVRRYREEIGRLQWAPVMDWMCEPWILEKTGLSVESHQRRTTLSYLHLRELAPEVAWVPVLQGWAEADYQRHWQQYSCCGIDLERLPVVGLGSVCRRQNTVEAARIVRSLQPLKLHGFGFKITGLSACADALVSADSMAWSVHGRYRSPMFPECTHKNCANCERWALLWRRKLLQSLQ